MSNKDTKKKNSSFTKITSDLLVMGWGLDSVGVLLKTPTLSLVNMFLFRIAIAILIYGCTMKIGNFVEDKLKE